MEFPIGWYRPENWTSNGLSADVRRDQLPESISDDRCFGGPPVRRAPADQCDSQQCGSPPELTRSQKPGCHCGIVTPRVRSERAEPGGEESGIGSKRCVAARRRSQRGEVGVCHVTQGSERMGAGWPEGWRRRFVAPGTDRRPVGSPQSGSPLTRPRVSCRSALKEERFRWGIAQRENPTADRVRRPVSPTW